ncbi:MAG: hypothetical protein BM556_13795 [Bacteriovorax sp. MedPE-SWde]|nr:MAG: hypothetical protein BM556_13795 [Bacteriovorax sp. MedPE-SWde]
MKTISIILTFLVALSGHAIDKSGKFSGRVSSISKEAKILRFKVDFENIKYINKMDEVEFWAQHQESFRCRAIVLGRSSSHILLKVPKFDNCNDVSSFIVGRYFYFYSKDLINNISMGKELIEILVKKRLALHGKISRNDKVVETYMQRVDGLNTRYEILRKKLLAEWKEELAKLEYDHQEVVRNNEGLKIRLNEVHHKLEKYRVKDENLVLDRWSLDPDYYYLK